MIVGDFSRTWPYDVMQNFDIITLADAPRSAFYLHGQFTAFRSQALYDNLLLADGYASPALLGHLQARDGSPR